jgi:hypothetical protein
LTHAAGGRRGDSPVAAHAATISLELRPTMLHALYRAVLLPALQRVALGVAFAAGGVPRRRRAATTATPVRCLTDAARAREPLAEPLVRRPAA